MTAGVGAVEPSGPAVVPAAASRPHRLVRLAGIAVAYYLGARLGLRLSLVGNDVTPLWPPTGVAVAALLVVGRSYWPALALAAPAGNLPLHTGPPPAAAAGAGKTPAPPRARPP